MGERKFCPDCGSTIFSPPPLRGCEFYCDECERVFHILDMGVPTSKRVAEIRAVLAREEVKEEWRCDLCGALKGMCPGHDLAEEVDRE